MFFDQLCFLIDIKPIDSKTTGGCSCIFFDVLGVQ
jgi:hypothetical protein